MRALSDELDSLSVEELERHDPSYIQGVRVLYDAAGTPQRDETAFRHALKTAHRAHKRGQRPKDTLIIDAYEHACRIAHAQDTLGRPDEMPPCATASPWPAASAPTPPPTRPLKRPEQASAPPNTSPPPNAAHYAPSAHAAAKNPHNAGPTPPKPSTTPTPANPSKPQTNAERHGEQPPEQGSLSSLASSLLKQVSTRLLAKSWTKWGSPVGRFRTLSNPPASRFQGDALERVQCRKHRTVPPPLGGHMASSLFTPQPPPLQPRVCNCSRGFMRPPSGAVSGCLFA